MTQDTFVQVFRAAGSYRPQGKPMAWLLRIARNLSVTRLRERGRTEAWEPEAMERLSENPRVRAEDRLVLETLLRSLSDEERQVVTLHAAGLKHREIAGLLGLPLPTVLSKAHRAVKKLQRVWKEELT